MKSCPSADGLFVKSMVNVSLRKLFKSSLSFSFSSNSGNSFSFKFKELEKELQILSEIWPRMSTRKHFDYSKWHFFFYKLKLFIKVEKLQVSSINVTNIYFSAPFSKLGIDHFVCYMRTCTLERIKSSWRPGMFMYFIDKPKAANFKTFRLSSKIIFAFKSILMILFECK